MAVGADDTQPCVAGGNDGFLLGEHPFYEGLRGAPVRAGGEPVERRKLAMARGRRHHGTASEKLAWELVRGRRLLGLKFRREQIIGGFIVDLFCHELCLCIEIDGGVHDDPQQAEWDRLRSEILEARGLRVVRIPAERVRREALEGLVRPLMNKR